MLLQNFDLELAGGQTHLQCFAGLGRVGSADDGAVGMREDGVAAVKDDERAELLELGGVDLEAGLLEGEASLDAVGDALLGAIEAAADLGEAESEVEAAELEVRLIPALAGVLEQGAGGAAELEVGFVDALLSAVDAAEDGGANAFDGDGAPAAGGLGDAIAEGLGHLPLGVVDLVEDGFAGSGEDFGGGGRGGGAEIGDEVGDGDVGFMADGGDDGNGGGVDGAGDDLLVEGPEVFERAAAAGHDDDFGPAGEGKVGQAFDDLFGGSGTLHLGGPELDLEAGEATFDDLEEVADDGSGGRGDDADALGEFGEGAFSGGVEEAFGMEALFELVEGELEGSLAEGFDGFDDELIFAAGVIDLDFAAGEEG